MAELSPGVDAERGPRLPASVLWAFVVRVGVILCLFGGFHAYVGLRLFAEPAWPAPWTLLGELALGALFVMLPAGMLLGRHESSGALRVLKWVAFIWLGSLGVFFTTTVAADLVGAVLRWTGTVTDPQALARGKALGVLLTALPAVGFAFLTARGRARVERVTVPVEGLGAGLSGLKVVQISDIHVGPTLDGKWLTRVVEQVNALAPDVVAVTGDLVDGSVEALRDEVAPLAGLRAKLGVFYVTGNHEYYHGGRAWAAEVARLGLTVLRNEHRVVERDGARLVVAGVTDYNAGSIDPEHASRPDLALAGAPADVPRVLLAHQPRSALSLQGLRVDLQLSGHTHGGQVFPFMFFVKLQQPVVRGLARVAGVRVYTHRGTGYWGPPLRLGPSPEIAELTLVPTQPH
ncbi:metallophosphoesterase [Corallococcus sp. H22C18031201]|uniref:metallophosphoesterase n=1 Tax=Citreicoccus inhibens TaxID=2849499 RepID=UPI000E7367D4|nr:metallophosphoesterase [Citreicoccus inhibens]MBU8895782.1 metallophosphoesterase [Citreicoccus inhibens]RJS20279.1 metallophosphoesterase [Corallococcus sp. H22C18031201]